MKGKLLLGFSLVIFGSTGIPVIAETRPNSANTTARPNVPTWKQFVEGGGGSYIKTDYDLPAEYRNGYVYFTQGANVMGAFIFKQGLSSYPIPKEDLSKIDIPLAEEYVKAGKAIIFSWNLGHSGLRNANNTEVRFLEPGTGCFKTTCLTAPYFSNSQISRILRSGRAIP